MLRDPVLERELQRVAHELRVDELARVVGRLALRRRRQALGGGQLARRRGGLVGLRGLLLLALGELRLDLAHGLVDERPRAVDDLHRLRLGELRARAAGAARRLDAARQVAGQAALEPEQPLEVRGQDEVREVLAHEHDDRVVAEPAVIVGRGLVGVGAARDERARRRRWARATAPSTAPPTASTATTASTGSGRRATNRATRSSARDRLSTCSGYRRPPRFRAGARASARGRVGAQLRVLRGREGRVARGRELDLHVQGGAGTALSLPP